MMNRVIIFLVLFCNCSNAIAQDAKAWKKRVSRTLFVNQNNNYKEQHKDAPCLIEVILQGIRSGKITAYSNINNYFTTPLSIADINRLTGPEIEIIHFTDSNGKEEIIKEEKEFDLKSLHQFRILEEWTFDPVKLQTEIQITGIAPLKGISGADGSYRGVQAIFWMKYNDIKNIIADYESSTSDNSLTKSIWNDHSEDNPFSEGYKEEEYPNKPLWQKTVLRSMWPEYRLWNTEEKQGMRESNLRDERTDSTWIQILAPSINSGKLPVYRSHSGNELLSIADIQQIPPTRTDSLPVEDPVTGNFVIKVIKYTYEHQSNQLSGIGTAEWWEYDRIAGTTKIKVLAIAPIYRTKIDGSFQLSKPVFWIRYKDMAPLLAQYEQYNPGNTLAGMIWNNYLSFDVKPERIK